MHCFPKFILPKNEPLHVSDSSSARKLSSNLYDIYQCQVYSEWIPNDGLKNCPKHVEVHFLAKINLGN
jgi:hypothetical protein